LAQWHTSIIAMLYDQLGEQDKESIRWHQKRSYGRSPIDEDPAELPDFDALLKDG
jgi:hypothetical protein